MFISFIEYQKGNQQIIDLLQFDDNAFFFFCLPPIVFASGFNMQRGDFFANISPILLFGVLGTFVAFFSFSAMTIFAKRNMQLWQYKLNLDTKEYDKIELNLTDPECLLFCSLMCSSDVVAAISLISYA